jgi:hypothetical protein
MKALKTNALKTQTLKLTAPKRAVIAGFVLALGGLTASAYADGKPVRTVKANANAGLVAVCHDSPRHSSRRDVIRLDIPVHVRGSARINLNRHLRHNFDIDPHQYRLRKVVVHNRSRHHGQAVLNAGGVRTRTAIHRGANELQTATANGPWMLGLSNARVNRVTVVLEPRRFAYIDKSGPRTRGSRDRHWM